MRDTGSAYGPLVTAEAASKLLDPPVSTARVREFVRIFEVPSRGLLGSGHRPGPQPKVYALNDLLVVHAIVIKQQAKFREESHRTELPTDQYE